MSSNAAPIPPPDLHRLHRLSQRCVRGVRYLLIVLFIAFVWDITLVLVELVRDRSPYSQSYLDDWGTPAYMHALLFVASVVLWFMWRSCLKQHARMMRQIQESPLSFASHPTALFLRPLFLTGEVRLKQNLAWKLVSFLAHSRLFSLYEIDQHLFDVEVVLFRSMLPERIVISVGGETTQFGSMRVCSEDDQWKALVTELIGRADIIFAVPFNQPGTRWEIELLRERGLLEKLLLIMPGDGVGSRIDVDSARDSNQLSADLLEQIGLDGLQLTAMAAEQGFSLGQFETVKFGDFWEASREAYEALGISLPRYDGRGGVFRASTSSDVRLFPLSIEGIRQATELLPV